MGAGDLIQHKSSGHVYLIIEEPHRDHCLAETGESFYRYRSLQGATTYTRGQTSMREHFAPIAVAPEFFSTDTLRESLTVCDR